MLSLRHGEVPDTLRIPEFHYRLYCSTVGERDGWNAEQSELPHSDPDHEFNSAERMETTVGGGGPRTLPTRVSPPLALFLRVSANEGSFLRWLKKEWLSRRSDSGHVVFLFVSSTSLFV